MSSYHMKFAQINIDPQMCKIYRSHMSLCQTSFVTANIRGPQWSLTNESAVVPHVFTVNVNKLAMLVHTQH